MSTELKSAGTIERFTQEFELALEQLSKAEPFAKARYQTEVFRLAADLMGSAKGLDKLYHLASRFDEAGLFHGGPWENPAKLLPVLVSGGLKGEGVYPTLEVLSELRILAIAKGKGHHENFSQGEAHAFLLTVMALNLDFLFPESTEESRERPKIYQRAIRLFNLLKAELTLEGLQERLLEEVENMIAQRPILNQRLMQLISYIEKMSLKNCSEEVSHKLLRFTKIHTAPSPLSQKADLSPATYRSLLLETQDEVEIESEIQAFKEILEQTGYGHPCHAVLLRYLGRKYPDRVPEALALNDAGTAAFHDNKLLSLQLLKVAIFPDTAYAIYGFSHFFERHLLSRSEVAKGLTTLVEIDIHRDVKKQLLKVLKKNSGLSANALLVAGTLSVLGQPLGIGQGNNPTCQAARGISLWSQHAPGFLIQIITSAARDNHIEMDFEGQALKSDELLGGVASGNFDLGLDPVSLILVPHLDRIYDEMMKRASYRGEDQHKWVNPIFYGRWVSKGFACVYDAEAGHIKDYHTFVRRFFATHHPSYNDDHQLIYPNPVGLFITDVHGNLLGLHAVSIQRITKMESHGLRIYFFNPNNEGRQKWGANIQTSVSGYGELAGESSLPFTDFVSRLYAFHYNPYEEGDAFAVPEETILDIEKNALESWGKSYQWLN